MRRLRTRLFKISLSRIRTIAFSTGFLNNSRVRAEPSSDWLQLLLGSRRIDIAAESQRSSPAGFVRFGLSARLAQSCRAVSARSSAVRRIIPVTSSAPPIASLKLTLGPTRPFDHLLASSFAHHGGSPGRASASRRRPCLRPVSRRTATSHESAPTMSHTPGARHQLCFTASRASHYVQRPRWALRSTRTPRMFLQVEPPPNINQQLTFRIDLRGPLTSALCFITRRGHEAAELTLNELGKCDRGAIPKVRSNYLNPNW
jgi:hypothetical protein